MLQLVSLAGLHSNAVVTGWSSAMASAALADCVTHVAELSARYQQEGMLAYVQMIQRKEKEIGCDVLTHQKWFV